MPGEIVGLLGRNGVGKSTILRTILGLVPTTSGAALFNGVDMTGMATHKRTRLGIACVPDNKGIFSSLTTYENLLVASIGSKRRDVEWVLDVFPILRERLKQIAGTLSGGEQQMLSIARALAVKPLLLLLDEVSEGLAPDVVAELSSVLQDLKREGTGVLLAEQNVQVCLSTSDRIYIILGGEVVFAGEADKAIETGAIDAYIKV
jgi:branched-chain amino acid transport system ATP-binding protein